MLIEQAADYPNAPRGRSGAFANFCAYLLDKNFFKNPISKETFGISRVNVLILKREALVSSGSTAVVFVCSGCGAVYKAFQQYTKSTQLGHFDCSKCTGLVHSWDGVYGYFDWTSIFPKKRRSPRLAKRLKITGPRLAPPRWTQEEDQQLLKMAEGDMTAAEIARSLKRTPGSIYSRLQRLCRRLGRNHPAAPKDP